MARSRFRRAAAALAAPLVLGATLVAPATSAQAHSNTWTSQEWRQTSNCWCELPDEWDGTYFQHDPGGEAHRTRIYTGDQLAGKVEFHPYGEKVWVYDTLANGDALYVHLTWQDNGRKDTYIKVPSGSRYTVQDLNIPDGTEVTITVYDDGWGTGYITDATAVA